MKFQATSVEFWTKDQAETVFFGNVEKELALLMSNIPGTSDHYLEWNDQSNACINAVEHIQLSGEDLQIKLFPKAAEQLGEVEFLVSLECDEILFKEVSRCLKTIFQDKLFVKQTVAKKKETPKKDFSKIKYLNLEGKNLKQLPDYVAELIALETVRLGNNPKLDFQSAFEVLAKLPNVKELMFTVEGGQIPENFGKLTGLVSLSVTQMTKPCRFPESIGHLKRLKKLLVMSDSEVVFPESFAELEELEELNVRAKSWQFASKFYKLAKLKKLELSDCRIQQVPAEMSQMSQVESVMFCDRLERDYAQILSVVAKMPNVKTLELTTSRVPQAIGLCKNIEKFVIWGGSDPENPLQFPDEFFDLTQLQELICHFVYLEKIPESIGKLTNLKTLVLKESEFESLPETIGELTHLELLNLCENPSLRSLPESVGRLTRLEKLFIEDIPQLTELPVSVKNLTNLKAVRLSNWEAMKNVPESWRGLLTAA